MAKKKSSAAVLDTASLNAMLEAVADAPLASERKSALRERIFAGLEQREKSPPGKFYTVQADTMQWQPFLPLVDIKILHRNVVQKIQLALWRLQPGAVLPTHKHECEEECWVIEGELRMEGDKGDEIVVCQGDMHIAPRGSVHPNIVAPDGALLFIRSQLFDIASP